VFRVVAMEEPAGWRQTARGSPVPASGRPGVRGGQGCHGPPGKPAAQTKALRQAAAGLADDAVRAFSALSARSAGRGDWAAAERDAGPGTAASAQEARDASRTAAGGTVGKAALPAGAVQCCPGAEAGATPLAHGTCPRCEAQRFFTSGTSDPHIHTLI